MVEEGASVLDQRGPLLRAALGFEHTPWHATQPAAWEALLKTD